MHTIPIVNWICHSFLGIPYFIEYVHRLGINIGLAIIEIRRGCISMRSLRAGMTFGRGCISMRSLRAGMTFGRGCISRWDLWAPSWLLASAWLLVSLNHVNVILSQRWFIEHVHTVGINMILAIIEIRRWCIRVKLLRAGMTFDVSEIRHHYPSFGIWAGLFW